MSADTFNSQPFSPPRNGPEDQAISVCNRCQGRLEYESDKKQNGTWYKLCSHCRSSARDYQRCRREKRATNEPDFSNQPRKVRAISSPKFLFGQRLRKLRSKIWSQQYFSSTSSTYAIMTSESNSDQNSL